MPSSLSAFLTVVTVLAGFVAFAGLAALTLAPSSSFSLAEAVRLDSPNTRATLTNMIGRVIHSLFMPNLQC